MTATLIAEALAAAERGTHVTFGTLTRVVVVDDDECVSDLFPGLSAVRTSGTASEDGCVYVRLDAVQIALLHLATRLERAEARIADLRAVASRMVCDSVQSYGVSDAFCACVTCQVKGYVGKEGEP